jgi:hypothetical protein
MKLRMPVHTGTTSQEAKSLPRDLGILIAAWFEDSPRDAATDMGGAINFPTSNIPNPNQVTHA